MNQAGFVGCGGSVSDGDRRLERWVVLLAASLLVIGRSVVFVSWEQSHFDADQAIVGLMAKHLAEGRAFPLFFYGQQYLLGAEAWVAAPFVAIAGASIAALKLPILLMNIALVVGLILSLERIAGLRPLAAGLASMFIVLPPPGTASRLVQANGCNIEPFLYVLGIWLCRSRPLWLGVVAGVGTMHREFTAYGITALLVVEMMSGRLFSRERVRAWTVTALVALTVWQAVQVLIPFASASGPGTSFAGAEFMPHAAEVARRFCWNEGQTTARVSTLFTTQLPELFGARSQPIASVGVISSRMQGRDGLWFILITGFALSTMRLGWLWWRRGRAPTPTTISFCAYLGIVGAQSALFYAVTCGQRSHLTMRYMLLALLAPIAISACYLAFERSRHLAAAHAGMIALWAVVSVTAHVDLLREYLVEPPPAEYRMLTDRLEQRGVRRGLAPFWDAYHVTYLSGERVKIGSTDLVRIAEYRREAEADREGAVYISGRPCEGERVARWWICPAAQP